MKAFRIDPGDPAHRVADLVSRHAVERWLDRRHGSSSAAQRHLKAEMRAAVPGGLKPSLAADRLDRHNGEAADYWVTNGWVFVVVGQTEGTDRVVATVYPRTNKYQPRRRRGSGRDSRQKSRRKSRRGYE